MELFSNPLADPQFLPFLFHAIILLLGGLLVMTLTQIRSLRKMVGSGGFKKFCSWVIIAPLLMLIVYSGTAIFLIFIAFLMWRGSIELMQMLGLSPFYRKVFAFNQLLTGATIVLAPRFAVFLPSVYFLVVFVAAGMRNQMFDVLKQVSLTIMGSIWIGYFLALLVLLYNRQDGRSLAMVVLGMVIVSDVFAFLCGSISRKIGIGTKPLASNISPNKVVAGVVGNVLGALLSMLMFGQTLGFPIWFVIVLVSLAGVGAAYGDLAESMVKRVAGVKDSSNLIPFHGGMMDRIDSLLFVVPIVFIAIHLYEEIPSHLFGNM